MQKLPTFFFKGNDCQLQTKDPSKDVCSTVNDNIGRRDIIKFRNSSTTQFPLLNNDWYRINAIQQYIDFFDPVYLNRIKMHVDLFW